MRRELITVFVCLLLLLLLLLLEPWPVDLHSGALAIQPRNRAFDSRAVSIHGA